MSTSRGRQDFSAAMARFGYDPHEEHPELKPKQMPVYLGLGEWGPPEPLEDDGGYGPEEDTSWMDGQ